VLDLRHGDGIDWEEILEKKMQVYFDLSGVKYEAARALGIAASHAVIDACRLHYERTGEAIPVVICYEECGIMEFLTPLAVDFAREHRKAGVSIWACSQTIRDFDEETFEQFLGLADEHHWYFLASGVERAAADLANPTFNPMEVHYTRDRIVTDSYDEVKTVSKGTSRGPDGKTRTDERVGTAYRPRTRVVVEEYFKSPQLHEQEFRTWLAQLKTGERYVRDRDGVRKEKLTMLGEPCPLGLTPIRTTKAIERIRSSHHFSQTDCAECDGKTSDGNSIGGSASTPAPSNNYSTSSPASTQQKSTSPKRSGREGSTSSGGSCGTNKKAADQETSTPADQSGKTAFGMNWQEP
jgi:hypothetical protein